MRVTLLAGGFGGARMAHGFALLGSQVDLTVIGNTGDDLELHGLHISPDLDTVMYTLCGLANEATGWGVRDETWSAAEMLERYGAPTWFRLGDRDLATHVTRTRMLREGARLTAVTGHLAQSLDVTSTLLPMTDDPVRTKLRTSEGWLDFQDYFVRRRHRDEVAEVRFDGMAAARPTSEVLEAIGSAELIVIAPSNPYVSVAPILALAGVADAMANARAKVIAVSPIVGGIALRGPAADMMRAFRDEPSAAGIAAYYTRTSPGLIDTLVLDTTDADLADAITAQGMTPLVAEIVIAREPERRRLAQTLVESADLG